MWVVSVNDGAGASMIKDSVSLAGWAADGQALLAQHGNQMLSIPLAAVSNVFSLRCRTKTRYVASPDGKFFSTRVEATSDIWLLPISRPE